MEKIRLGTIGSGKIVHSILNGVMETDGISLEAVYSRTNAKAEELAAKYGCCKTYTDIDMFLRDNDINTVYIASPNSLHYYQGKMSFVKSLLFQGQKKRWIFIRYRMKKICI